MKRNVNYQPAFPWFGAKSPVAAEIWEALGDPVNYVEPFFGSGAVLFLRPGGAGHIETVNDADGFITNFWRAMRADSDAVADAADNPVNEADLHARHLWLLGQRERITDALCGDETFYDAKAAGYWAWGLCCWIGSGWCSGNGPWTSEDGLMVLGNPGKGVNRQLPHLGAGKGVSRQRPHLGDHGQGVSRKLPHLGAGQGVNRQLPHLGNPGQGVNRQLPHLGNPGQGVNRQLPHLELQTGTCAERREWLVGYLRGFADRLRNVRVCCGDWSRVCGPSVTFRHGPTGVFLDPPYADSAKRTANLYAVDCEQVAHAVREWAIEQGKNPLMRICIAGYSGEHEMPADWRIQEWQAAGGYGLQGESDEEGTGRANKHKERLWFSPHCRRPAQSSLFGEELEEATP